MRCNTCAILAGGAARRFGGITKSKLVVGGKPVISRILETVEDLFDEVVIVANNPGEFTEFGKGVICDIITGIGPLGGIHAALKAARGEAVFVLGGDMPFPDRKIISEMLTMFEGSKARILTPYFEDRVEPLHSIYMSNLAIEIEKYAAKPGMHAVYGFFGHAGTEYFRHDNSLPFRRAFMNINNPGDLEKAEELLADL